MGVQVGYGHKAHYTQQGHACTECARERIKQHRKNHDRRISCHIEILTRLTFRVRKIVDELIDRLKILERGGFVKTHRSDNTGVGKTLEDLLGIKENNIPGPNGHMIEIKGGRKQSSSMFTLFTKFPLPRGINSKLRTFYGYPSEGLKDMHITISTDFQYPEW